MEDRFGEIDGKSGGPFPRLEAKSCKEKKKITQKVRGGAMFEESCGNGRRHLEDFLPGERVTSYE